jgi:hypothetical protein
MRFAREDGGRTVDRSIESENQTAALAAELTTLVDRLEADWRLRGVVDQANADQLHKLHDRAARLFDGPTSPSLQSLSEGAC